MFENTQKMDSDDAVVYFAKTNFRGADKIFGIKRKDRRQHTYVIGKTGCGKSVLLKNMAIQDIHAGRGLAVVDPHGELVEELLTLIPPHRINDVIYFNPADMDHPVGFNILEVPDPRYKHIVASDLMGVFTKIWANVWSARMEYILQNCVLALLDTEGSTMLGISRILVDKEYRAKIVANIKDPVVKAFWVHEYEGYTDRLRSEAIVPIQNKVGQFLNTSLIRNVVGQPKSTFDVREVMNDGKILLVNVSKGRIGEDNGGLLGAMVITKLQLAAMERIRIPEEERRDFYLYVDEFQNFATESFASTLSEARKYRLNLIIAHQYIGQLVTDVSTKVRDAVFGNVGTEVVFRVGATDAEFLEEEFAPEFMPQDLVNLPNYNVCLKLMVDGVTSRPFSASTLPPIKAAHSREVAEKVIAVSRERYAKSREEVEDRINRWSGLIEHEQGFVSGGEEAKGVKETYDATCSSCGKSTKIPFKPDPRRPIFCKNCLKKRQEGEILPISTGAEERVYPGTPRDPGVESQAVREARPLGWSAARRAAPTPRTMQATSIREIPQTSHGPHVPLHHLPERWDAPAPSRQHSQEPPRFSPNKAGPIRRNPIPSRPPFSRSELKTASTPAPISLRKALTEDPSSFYGKKIKRKEVDLSSLRQALEASIGAVTPAHQTHTDTPLPEAPGEQAPLDERASQEHNTVTAGKKGTALKPGERVKLGS